MREQSAVENNTNETLIESLNKQIVEHLKSQGITVHGREELIKYLEEHGYVNLQESKINAGSQLFFALNVRKPKKQGLAIYALYCD